MSDEQIFASLCRLRTFSSELIPLGPSSPSVFTFNVKERCWSDAKRCVDGIVANLREDDFAIDVDFSSSNLGFKLYENSDSLLWRVTAAEISSQVGALPSDSKSGFLILKDGNIVCSSANDDATIRAVENLIAFIGLVDFLKSSVADYHDPTLEEIVFISPVSGAVKLSTRERQFVFTSTTAAIRRSSQRLISEVQQHGACQFLKYELARIMSDLPPDTRLRHFLNNLDAFTDRSLRQAEIAFAGNKLDDFVSEFRAKIEAYFASVQTVINRVGATIISIPVTLGSSVFATLQIESALVTIASTVVYVVYSVFAVVYQIMAWHDVAELETQLKKDEARLKVVAPRSAADFLEREESVLRRVKLTRVSIIGVTILLIAFAVGVVYLATMNIVQTGGTEATASPVGGP